MLSLSLSYLKRNWLGNIRNDVLAGMVVALALIPELSPFLLLQALIPRSVCMLHFVLLLSLLLSVAVLA